MAEERDDDRKCGRNADGTFAPGNPGKPPGTRHRISLILERVMAADGVAVTKAVVEAAKAGDMTAARLILDRLVPPRKGRPVALDLPEVREPGDVPAVLADLLAAVGRGELSPEEAAAVAAVVETARRGLELVELEQRVAEVERRLAGDGA